MAIIIENKKKFTMFVIGTIIILAILIKGGFWAYERYIHPDTGNPDDYLTLSDAADMGEVKTYKLMIQISNSSGNIENVDERYQRGDIILVLPADHKFSVAEKTGFLIIEMDLTKKQTDLLIMSLDKIKKEKDEETGFPQRERLRRRKYMVDLSRLGIAPDDEKGREIANQIFDWKEVVLKKKI